jgi:hypothetical protein
VRRDLPAARLLGLGLCSAACLVSMRRAVDSCSCACQGRWHGSLSDVPVPGSANATVPPSVVEQPDLFGTDDDVMAAFLGSVCSEQPSLALVR